MGKKAEGKRKRVGNRMGRLLRQEGVLYIIVGIMTTAVNFVFFWGFDRGLERAGLPAGLSYKLAYGIAFLAAVIFAYWTNKLWVFKNRDLRPSYLLKEFTGFFSVRVISGLLTFLLMILFVDFMSLAHNPAWLLTTFVNLIFNYVASKFWIFRKEKTDPVNKDE